MRTYVGICNDMRPWMTCVDTIYLSAMKYVAVYEYGKSFRYVNGQPCATRAPIRCECVGSTGGKYIVNMARILDITMQSVLYTDTMKCILNIMIYWQHDTTGTACCILMACICVDQTRLHWTHNCCIKESREDI